MGVALENARLFGETKRLLAETDQRAAELAVINEIGAALAEQLEFTAIIELVGERIRTLFEARSSYIALYDGATGVISFPWEVEGNERLHTEPFDLGPGLTSEVIRTRKSLLLRTSAEAQARGAIQFGPTTETWLGVPILAGDRVLGVIALESAMASAYDDSDERLLSTLASSMGVALENARLFDETKRLLAETDERAAELAIINGVQQGLAAQLDLQAMYDLVGDKIQEIFDAQVVDIGIYDFDAGVVHYPYTIERGLRFPDEPTAISAMTREFIEARTPLVINDVPAWEEERGEIPVIQGEPALSIVRVPLMVGGDVRGGISLQNLDRTDAFSDDDIRLLSTLAGSLSVALENARLFGETKRLLTETDERAAELAIINEVQRGLAERLDMVAMYEVVGGKIQEIFDAQVVDIGIVDREADQIRFPVHDRAWRPLPRRADGDRRPTRACPPDQGATRLQRGREPARQRDGSDDRGPPGRARPVGRVCTARRRRRGARRHLAPEPGSRERVLRWRRPPAHHACGQSERRARECPPDRRDPPPRRRARHRQPGRSGDRRATRPRCLARDGRRADARRRSWPTSSS